MDGDGEELTREDQQDCGEGSSEWRRLGASGRSRTRATGSDDGRNMGKMDQGARERAKCAVDGITVHRTIGKLTETDREQRKNRRSSVRRAVIVIGFVTSDRSVPGRRRGGAGVGTGWINRRRRKNNHNRSRVELHKNQRGLSSSRARRVRTAPIGTRNQARP